MKLLKLSILGAALIVAGSLIAQTTPNCGGTLPGTLLVGMDLTPTGTGAPFESVNSSGNVVGFDSELICDVAAYLGYSGVKVLSIANANFATAIANGTVAVIISGGAGISTITLPTQSFISYVKYNDVVLNQAASGLAIIVNAGCCQLYANIASVIATLASNGTLAALRTKYNVPVNSYTPLSGLVPTACTSTAVALPQRNEITNFILTNFCLGPCTITAPTTVTTP